MIQENILWILLAAALLFIDYSLICLIGKYNSNSDNVYFKLHKKHGTFKLTAAKLIGFSFILYSLFSWSEFSQESAKILIQIYCFVVLTLIFNLLFKRKKKKRE